jgi:large subunit ribosomal protein L18
MKKQQGKRYRRHKRVRAKIFGTLKRPRLCAFRSNKHIYAQLIDDEKGKTLATASDLELKPKTKKGKSKVAVAYEVGKLIAEKALGKKFAEASPNLTPRSASQSSAIEKVVFDRGGYKYHGRIKALAEVAREGGLKI